MVSHSLQYLPECPSAVQLPYSVAILAASSEIASSVQYKPLLLVGEGVSLPVTSEITVEISVGKAEHCPPVLLSASDSVSFSSSGPSSAICLSSVPTSEVSRSLATDFTGTETYTTS